MSWHDLSLTHYSREPIERITPPVPRADGDVYHKPVGLWVSVDGEDDWPSWCRAEEFHLDALACATRIMLKPDAQVLHISSPEGIDDLTNKLGPAPKLNGVTRHYALNWPALYDEFQAVIIAPYQWSRRLSEACTWYYSWDCASGCIWDVDAVSHFEPIEH